MNRLMSLGRPSPQDIELASIVELARYRARQQPRDRAYVYLKDGEIESEVLSYEALDRRARAIAAWLQQYVTQGARVALAYAPGLDFISGFFGCLYAGVVAVPVYPPNGSGDVRRFARILSDAGCAAVCTHDVRADAVRAALASTASTRELPCLSTGDCVDVYADQWLDPGIGSDSLAFLQYTSGSTGTPKGVMVSHGNLLHNQRLIARAFQHSNATVGVSWLPLYHDMGLIGHVLQPLYLGVTSVLMAPTAFIFKPVRWLQAITRYRATSSGGPNFAYDLCLRRITEKQMAGLDLRSWDLAFNGSETVRLETMQRFAQKFAACGFRREAFLCCYGMAESTLFVSGTRKNGFPTAKSLDSNALERHRVLVAGNASKSRVDVVSCGRVLDQEVAIVDPDRHQRCAPEGVGEIWLKGESVAHGYWRNPDSTAATFQAHIANSGEGPFLRTGDLGFIQNGELHVTGRLKELIIIRGRNYYPHDIEAAVRASHPAFGGGAGAAFSIAADDEERLVVAHEVGRSELRRLPSAEVIGAARLAVMAQLGLTLHDLVLLKHGSLPKTSSGKIRRRAFRDAYMNGRYERAGAPITDSEGVSP